VHERPRKEGAIQAVLDAVVRRQVVRRGRLARGGEIGRRAGDDRLPWLRHLHGDHVAGGEIADRDGGVEAFGHHVHRPVAQRELELHARIGREEAPPHRRDDCRRRPGADMEAQPARRAAALVLELGQGLLDAGEGGTQRIEKAPARVGQRHAPCRTIEQTNVEPLFELLHGMAQSRSADAEPVRAGAKAQHLGNRDEGSEIGQLGPFHAAAVPRRHRREDAPDPRRSALRRQRREVVMAAAADRHPRRRATPLTRGRRVAIAVTLYRLQGGRSPSASRSREVLYG
jgi:hypothetical protein